MKKLLRYSAIFIAIFVTMSVAIASVSATSILYAGNAGYTIYPTLVNDSNTTFVAMYNSNWTGPSAALESYAWKTVDPGNYSNVTYSFTNFDIIFFDMGEFWYYPFGDGKDSNGNVLPGAYNLSAAAGKKLIALRSANFTTGSHLTPYPFAIIDDPNCTSNGSYYQNANSTTKAYLLNFFNQSFYNYTNPYFIGNSTQANAFVNYVENIPT